MKIVVFALSVVIFFGVEVFAQSEWKVAKEKQGIIVKTRTSKNSSLKDSKSEMIITASLDKVYNFIMDISKHKEWMDKVGESQILKKISDTEYYAYYIGSAPWPVSDRDIIAHYTVEKLHSGSVKINAVGEADYIPVKDNRVRVPYSISYWELIPLVNHQLKIVYYTSSDPGGKLPAWLANTAAEDTPYSSMKELKARMDKRIE